MGTQLERWVQEKTLVTLFGFQGLTTKNPQGYIQQYDAYGIEFKEAYGSVILVPWSSISFICKGLG